MKGIDIVREHLQPAELFAQLAEEATELAKAALKMRRAITDVNPTPITEAEAYGNLIEELADVRGCLMALEIGTDSATAQSIRSITEVKMERWATRLTEGATT